MKLPSITEGEGVIVTKYPTHTIFLPLGSGDKVFAIEAEEKEIIDLVLGKKSTLNELKKYSNKKDFELKDTVKFYVKLVEDLKKLKLILVVST